MKFDLIQAGRHLAGKAIFFAKDKSPEICFVGGIACIIGAGYFLWNAKGKCAEVLEEYRKDMEPVKEMEKLVESGVIPLERHKEAISNIKKDRLAFGMKAAVAFVRIFAPVVLLTLGGFALFGKSTAIYKGRYLASAAVCAEQNRYIEELQKGEGGELKIPKGPYVLWFDERSREFVPGDAEGNKMRLIRAITYAEDKRRTEGACFGNQFIKFLDLHTGNERIIGTQVGQIMGWSDSKNPEDGAAGYVDVGIDWDNTDFGEPILLIPNWDKTPLWNRCGMAVA